jgi:hypothetical protein
MEYRDRRAATTLNESMIFSEWEVRPLKTAK